MMSDIENTYKTNKANPKSLKVLNSSLKTKILVAKILAFLYISAGFSFLMTPIAIYFLTGEVVPILEAYLPGLDYKTTQGYIISNFLHFFYIFVAVCEQLMFDVVFFVFYFHIVTLNELMKIKMEEIGEYLMENDLKISENAKKVKDMMKEIYEQHRDMLKCALLSVSPITRRTF
jgi:hypothetical protein